MPRDITDPRYIAHTPKEELKEALESCKEALARYETLGMYGLTLAPQGAHEGLKWWIRLYRNELRRRLV